MFDEVNKAIDEYLGKWQALVAWRKNKEFFERLRPTAVAWKVADLAEYDRLLHQWRDSSNQVVETWMNDRWIAVMDVRDKQLHGDIQILELMQRRPNTDGALGLSHIDFMDMEQTNTKAILDEETGVDWSDGQNGSAVWTSIKFDGGEAKLREGTVLDQVITELQEANNKVRGHKFARPVGDQAPHVSEVE